MRAEELFFGGGGLLGNFLGVVSFNLLVRFSLWTVTLAASLLIII